MRIGIARSASDSLAGGVFQYEIVFLKALAEIAARRSEKFVYLCYHPNDVGVLATVGGLNFMGIPIVLFSKSSTPQQRPPEAFLAQRPATPPVVDPNAFHFDHASAEALKRNDIDLMLVLSPFIPAFSFGIPFVIPIFDLNHRLQPEFQEVSAFGEANGRDHFYVNTCKFATLILVDSEIGKADVLQFYGHLVNEDRIRILPYYPPINNRPKPSPEDLTRVRKKYNLPLRYFFYPAQFWPHKNHALILQAIKRIAGQSGEIVPVVFCGSYWTYIMAHNFKDLMALAAKLGVTDRVWYLGSVPDEDMAALYTLSAGLVMPTFFGPTNIPPLEAWHFGRPVITSDIRGAREQNGDAGLLIDPRSPEALADAMLRVWRDQSLCETLVARGRKRLATYKWNSFVDAVEAIVTEACERVASGRSPSYPDMKSVARSVRRA